MLLTGLTLYSGACTQGHLRFSQVSCEPFVHLPCSKTPAGPPRQASCGVSVLPSHRTTSKAPAIQDFRSSITRLLHCLFTLRAALSSDYAKLTSDGQPNLVGWAFPCPLSSFGEFPLCRFPSPRTYLGATSSSSSSILAVTQKCRATAGLTLRPSRLSGGPAQG